MAEFGREMTEGRRRGSGLEGMFGVDGGREGWSCEGCARDKAEDCAEGRVRESFFMFLERDFEGGGKTKESESEVAEERESICCS